MNSKVHSRAVFPGNAPHLETGPCLYEEDSVQGVHSLRDCNLGVLALLRQVTAAW